MIDVIWDMKVLCMIDVTLYIHVHTLQYFCSPQRKEWVLVNCYVMQESLGEANNHKYHEC